MRQFMDNQIKFNQVPIDQINFDLSSRDDIPKLLIGLQTIYCERDLLSKIEEILRPIAATQDGYKKGRPGMPLWNILVLGCLRLCCNLDYDRLKDLADNHVMVRMMLGHVKTDFEHIYPLQTLKDNLRLFTPEMLNQVNQAVVAFGHQVIGVGDDQELHCSCDSYVLITDVHFPTDINLLWDAVRKIILLTVALCLRLGIVSGWREWASNLKQIKRMFLDTQRMKHSTAKDPDKRKERQQLIIAAHLRYIEMVQQIVDRAYATLDCICAIDAWTISQVVQIKVFIEHAERQIEQIKRRVENGESIAHHEKVFSLFEEHTEWISKGKAGTPQELGLRVSIVKDQFSFILNHMVMQHQTDDKVAVPIIAETKALFPAVSSCSFDKGYHSPQNQIDLAEILDDVYLPRKGRLSAINAQIESSQDFKEARRKHSAVEAAISCLESHGLDRCPDHGLHGFKRYVALGILARNIHLIGHLIQQKELKKIQRRRKRERLNLAA